jgi:hypothetical protein
MIASGLLARVGRMVEQLERIQWKIFRSDPPHPQ